jgi:ABC-type glutathione transport system ATPase component
MTMRLGFALVTALDPGVLLMDEGFGTGDLRFAERAEARMKGFVSRSRIMVLASHSESTIKSMCNKAIMLEAGKIVASGPVDEIYDRYYESVHKAKRMNAAAKLAARRSRAGLITHTGEILVRDVNLQDRLNRTRGMVRFTTAAARDGSGAARWEYEPGETVHFQFEYEVFEKVSQLALLFRLNLAGSSIHNVTDIVETISLTPLEAGHRGTVGLTLPNLKLMPNDFDLYVCLISPEGMVTYDVIDANVGLPSLVVKQSSPDDIRLGVVSLGYELQSSCVNESAATETALPMRIGKT